MFPERGRGIAKGQGWVSCPQDSVAGAKQGKAWQERWRGKNMEFIAQISDVVMGKMGRLTGGGGEVTSA
jgi:hypothetical protein